MWVFRKQKNADISLNENVIITRWIFSKCEASLWVYDVATHRPHLTIISRRHIQPYRPQIFSNIKIFGNAADRTVSLRQITAGQFQLGNGVRCSSQVSAAGGVCFTEFPVDKRQRSSRRTAIGIDRILGAGQRYVVRIRMTCNALWGTLVFCGHVSRDTITVTSVDWKHI